MTVSVLVIMAAALGVLGFLVWRYFGEAQKLRGCYAHIIDAEAHIGALRQRFESEQSVARTKLEEETAVALAKTKADRERSQAAVTASTAELERLECEQRQFKADTKLQRETLEFDYRQALATYNELKREVSLLEENVEDISFGVYKPHFTFQTSEQYKSALARSREVQRELIRLGRAAVCATKWTVQNSERDGERMTKQYIKLILRAFNSECDAAVANVTWNNITKMEERVSKSYEVLNALGGVMQMSVTPEYLQLKLDELRLAHEYEDKRHQEREEQRRIREQIREEERAQREFEKAREDAEREEARYQKALERAREEALRATGAQLEKLTDQITKMEKKLDEAHNAKQKAISRAQLTKSGFVYVISNVGSFGERVCKIGMTRRMEPMERIAELGDASVPFPFDLHVMLYSDNAPELEGALHELFEERRVNLINRRREFYHEVNLEEIEQFVKSRGLSAQFMKVPEAREYRETLALREQRAAARATEASRDRFADALFTAPSASKSDVDQ